MNSSLQQEIDGVVFIVLDELVFQALTASPLAAFDKLHFGALQPQYGRKMEQCGNLSALPSLWAHYYIRDRVAKDFDWDTRKVNANDIEKFIEKTVVTGESARKVATQPEPSLLQRPLSEYISGKVERWWSNSLFLTLDRMCVIVA